MLQWACSILEIETQFVFSSILSSKNNKGQERIIDICNELNASTYINLPGGRELYSENYFSREGINLEFITPNLLEYDQTNIMSNFIPNLSVFDLIMQIDLSKVDSYL